MKCVVGNQPASSRTPEGPIAPHIGSFGEFLGAQGYALSSIHRQVLLAACFSRWLKQERVELHRITSDHSRRYLRYRARQIKPGPGDAAALRHLLEFLRGEDLIPAETVPVPQLTPVERYTTAYAQHLREAQALAEATIRNYGQIHRAFYVLSRQIGLRGASDSHGPRLHDLRHYSAYRIMPNLGVSAGESLAW
jgi:integrase/recombinase XerD